MICLHRPLFLRILLRHPIILKVYRHPGSFKRLLQYLNGQLWKRNTMFNRHRCGSPRRLSGQNRWRDDAERIPSPSRSASASAAGNQVIKTRSHQRTVRHFIQAVAVFKVANYTDRCAAMPVTSFCGERLVSINTACRSQLRHGRQHVNITRKPWLQLFLCQHFQLIVLQIAVYCIRIRSLIKRKLLRMIPAMQVRRSAIRMGIGPVNILRSQSLFTALERNTFPIIGVIICAFHSRHACPAKNLCVPRSIHDHLGAIKPFFCAAS